MQNGKDGTQMKATGIVRRIDELGRVVIPKEIRRTQRVTNPTAVSCKRINRLA